MRNFGFPLNLPKMRPEARVHRLRGDPDPYRAMHFCRCPRQRSGHLPPSGVARMDDPADSPVRHSCSLAVHGLRSPPVGSESSAATKPLAINNG